MKSLIIFALFVIYYEAAFAAKVQIISPDTDNSGTAIEQFSLLPNDIQIPEEQVDAAINKLIEHAPTKELKDSVIEYRDARAKRNGAVQLALAAKHKHEFASLSLGPDSFIDHCFEKSAAGNSDSRCQTVAISIMTQVKVGEELHNAVKAEEKALEKVRDSAKSLSTEYKQPSFLCLGDYGTCASNDIHRLACGIVFIICLAERLVPALKG